MMVYQLSHLPSDKQEVQFLALSTDAEFTIFATLNLKHDLIL